MDDSYWASLKGLGIFLFLCLLALFLGLTIFTYVYDYVSVFPVWESPLWLRLKIPVIVLGASGFLFALILFIRRQGIRELRAIQEYARSQGWGFSRNDPGDLKQQVANILQDLRFYLRYVRTVETGRRKTYLFDCSYKHRDERGSSHDSQGTVCLIQSERFRADRAPVEIITRDWTEFMVSDKVDLGPSPFSKAWLVLSKDADLARGIVSESVQAVLLDHLRQPDHDSVSVTIGPGGAVVLTGRITEQERLQVLVDLARDLESAMD